MAVNVDTGSNVARGPLIVKQVTALAYQKCSSDHSLEGIVKKNKVFLFTKWKKILEDFSVKNNKKFYVYWRAREKFIKIIETPTVSPKVSQGLFFWRNWSHSDELSKVSLG